MAFTVGELSAPITADMSSFNTTIGKVHKEGLSVAKGIQKQFEDVGRRMQSIGNKMSAAITLPLVGVGGLALKTAADYEKLRQSMDILNGSAEEGARNFERLKEFSARTPFQLQGLAEAQNMLQGFGLSADDAFESISMIGDIAAVSGGDIKGIGIAFGQAAAEGRLMTRDIRQLINQGVPAIKLLADTMGVAQSDVLDLASQGEISFEILQRAFRDATQEGGMFANGMEKQSKTLSGVFSTLKDNVSIALADIGVAIDETFDIKGIIRDLTSQIQQSIKWFNSLSETTRATGLIIAGLTAVIGPVLTGLGFMVGQIGNLVPLVSKLAGGVKILTSAMIANPYLAVGAAIAAIAVASWQANKAVKAFNKSVNDTLSGQADSWQEVNDMIAKVSDRMDEIRKGAAIAGVDPSQNQEFVRLQEQLEKLIDLRNKLAGEELQVKIKTDQLADTEELINFINTDFSKLFGQASSLNISRPFVEAQKPVHELIQALDMVPKKMKELSADEILADEGKLDLGEKLFPPESLGALQERLAMLREQMQFAFTPEQVAALQEQIGLTTEQINNLTGATQEAAGAGQVFGQALGQAMSQAVLHAKRFDDVLKNILKQLASQVLVQFVTAIITGGSSLAKGSIGKALFGGLFHSGGIVPGSGEKMVLAKGGEGIFTQPQMKALGNMNGGSGMSESKLQHAFERALGAQLQKLGPEEMFILSQRGKFSF